MFVEKHVLILATTNDFLLKFEQDNVALLQAMGYTVHYAANLWEPAYLSDRAVSYTHLTLPTNSLV